MLNTIKTNGKVIAKKVNREKYGSLLTDALPTVIRTRAENEYYLSVVERLMQKESRLSKEETALLDLLSLLIETFERQHYQIRKSEPRAILTELMASNRLKQGDLLSVFGTKGRVSEVVNGKRAISKEQAKKLAAFFHVSAELFI
ncbi:MAG: transcriptional regulator [Acidobacteria bacterium]|nr:transcriptional regulator [Acidobacteriota bacterium]